jgi:FkbM family methyltransferase
MLESIRLFARAWKYRQRNEVSEIAYLRQHISRGDLAVDVGAHKGAYLYWMRKLVGPEGRVVAFEPQPQLAQLLKRIVSHKGWKNVVIENAGVSSKPGRMMLHVPDSSSGTSPSASLCPKSDESRSGTKLSVDVVTLDDYFAQNKIDRIDFLKCDVEGHELEVFRGAANILKSFHPRLLFECEGRHHEDGSVTSVFEFLESLGYRGRFFLDRDLVPIDQLDLRIHQSTAGERYWERPGYCCNFAFENRAA